MASVSSLNFVFFIPWENEEMLVVLSLLVIAKVNVLFTNQEMDRIVSQFSDWHVEYEHSYAGKE